MISRLLRSGSWPCLQVIRLVAVGLAIFVLGGCGKRSSADIKAPAKLREEAVERVKKGEIGPDASGTAPIPQELKQANTEGDMCISRDANGGIIVVFFRGPDEKGNLQGILYTDNAPSGRFRAGPFQWMLGLPTQPPHWFMVSGKQ